MPLFKKIGAAALAAGMTVSCLALPASADEAYYGYNYNWWNEPVPSQNGYVVDRVVTGVDLGVGTFSEPNDIFVDNETGDIYLVDTNNGRIVITDENLTRLRYWTPLPIPMSFPKIRV